MLLLEGVCYELFLRFWGGQHTAGGCGCVCPLFACKDRVQAGFVGSLGTSRWVAMQKVIVSAKKDEVFQV